MPRRIRPRTPAAAATLTAVLVLLGSGPLSGSAAGSSTAQLGYTCSLPLIGPQAMDATAEWNAPATILVNTLVSALPVSVHGTVGATDRRMWRWRSRRPRATCQRT